MWTLMLDYRLQVCDWHGVSLQHYTNTTMVLQNIFKPPQKEIICIHHFYS